jgi:hypothetical protein
MILKDASQGCKHAQKETSLQFEHGFTAVLISIHYFHSLSSVAVRHHFT